jgi:glycosyltransferase involved in cell wall biosynthesis
LVAVHSAAAGGAQAMGLAEAERFGERCEIVAAVPDGPLRERFEEFAEVVAATPSLPTWPTTPAHWAWRLLRSVRDAPRLARVIRRRRVDAVITCSTVLFTPVLAARLARVPVVVHAREWPVTRLGRAVFALHRWLADVVVAISGDVEERLAGRGRARIVRIADGITMPSGSPRPPDFGRPLRMCVVGALTGGDGKGQHRAVQTLALLEERGLEATLTIAGPLLDREYTERVRSTASELAVSDRVELIGPSADVPGLLSEHALLLFCSREGADVTPLILMEALAEERPVVAADVGSVHEVLGDGRYGELVPAEDPGAMADAVLRVAADPERAGRKAAEGREHVRRDFDRETGLERLWEVVENAIQARRPRPTS